MFSLCSYQKANSEVKSATQGQDVPTYIPNFRSRFGILDGPCINLLTLRDPRRSRAQGESEHDRISRSRNRGHLELQLRDGFRRARTRDRRMITTFDRPLSS